MISVQCTFHREGQEYCNRCNYRTAVLLNVFAELLRFPDEGNELAYLSCPLLSPLNRDLLGMYLSLAWLFLGWWAVGGEYQRNRIYNIMPFSADRLMSSFGYVRVKTKPWFCNNGLDRSCQTSFWVVKNIWKYFCQIIIYTVLCWPWKSLLVFTNCSSHLYNLCEVGLVGFFEMNLYYH